MMSFNYSKLLGRIKEYGYTQETLAKKIVMAAPTINQKLNNKAPFKQKDIREICDVLEIPCCEIGDYFFCSNSSEIPNG